MDIDLPNIEAANRLGAWIAAQLRPGDAVLLQGELGAGKTALARAILRAAAASPTLEVPSPSYTLLQTYEAGPLTLHHLDLWRLTTEASVLELGWEELCRDIVLVEWPDRLGTLAPDALTIELTRHPGEARRAHLQGWQNRPPPPAGVHNPPPRSMSSP